MTLVKYGFLTAAALILIGCAQPPAETETASPEPTISADELTDTLTETAQEAAGDATATAIPQVVITAPPVESQPTVAAVNPPSSAPAAPPASGAPSIQNFTASATNVEPGGDITFTWASSGGGSAYIYENYQNGYGKRGFAVPPNGSLTVATDGDDRYTHVFSLHVYQNADPANGGQYASSDINVTFACHVAAFYPMPPGLCPDAAANTYQAAEQVFEHGRMVWLQNWIGGSNLVIVLMDNGTFAVFQDNWRAGDVESDPALTPPVGMIQPVRGFGKVWREQPGIRTSLGWAITSEQGYATPYQTASNAAASGGGYQYLKLSDGRVIGLWPMFHWEFINP